MGLQQFTRITKIKLQRLKQRFGVGDFSLVQPRVFGEVDLELIGSAAFRDWVRLHSLL
jgi:hypothetical protein